MTPEDPPSGRDSADDCFHCGLPIPRGAHYPVSFEGRSHETCCGGCQAVANAIIDNGLGGYYHHRTAPAGSPGEPLIPDELRELKLFDEPEVQRQFVTDETDRASGRVLREASLILEGITCAACVWLNERHVRAIPGVSEFAVNYSTHRARVRWDPERLALSDILQAIRAIGYRAHPYDPGTRDQAFRRERHLALRRLAVAGLGMMQVMMLAVALWLGAGDETHADLLQFMRWVAAGLTTPVVFYSALPFFQSAWRDLRQRQLGMDVPVSLAIASTYAASVYSVVLGTGEHVYFESVAMFVFFLLTSRYLELMARQRSSQAIDRLDRLIPALAVRIDASGRDEQVPVAQLVPGDRVRVRPGEPLPADGVVDEGESTVNQALLTGEPEPCPRRTGDPVTGGTVNVDSPLVVRVTRVGAETTLAAIQRLLDRAQTEKPRLARLAEKGTGHFVAAVLILTALVGLTWYLWIAPDRAFWVVVAMLVATCPCALALATPVAITTTTGVLSRMGLLLTRGQAIEDLARARVFCFDKTGTLTIGHPEWIGTQVLAPGWNEQTLLAAAAALERHSEHPLARALVRAAGDRELPEVHELLNSPGRGLAGRVGGHEIRVGTPQFVGLDRVPDDVRPPPANGHATAVWMARDGQVLGVFWFADPPRPQMEQTVQELRELGLAVVLLSGDRPEAVAAFAARAGIEEAHGGMTPEDKVAYVRARQADGEIVVMAGEGINDAPVLAGADISLAMGSGTRIAQTQSDLVLMSDRLEAIPAAVQQARRTLRIVRQNIAWAVGYNALALPVAATGLLTPWLAALGMSLSSLLVVGNALRLRQVDQEQSAGSRIQPAQHAAVVRAARDG
ncbi:heavy metal translocating P-type ATPase [Thioalkalivibrio paradoxus]|uniref:P-type Cu(2+) transporter n=1 Tax=Thioalkalivibrio paradoxus ARh 1 TaxID=713585 RepID=W0DQV0_9GAMM|nr:heavy metal translocating P-type ATPase [Thioalkalivibrio paradoxus]AHE99627.1 cation transporter [Thioalkalivibrio paradoxus ARh 1]